MGWSRLPINDFIPAESARTIQVVIAVLNHPPLDNPSRIAAYDFLNIEEIFRQITVDLIRGDSSDFYPSPPNV